MSDRLHDHLTLGIRRGCVACAQVEADLALAARALHECPHDETNWVEPDLSDPTVFTCPRCGVEVYLLDVA